MTTTPEQAAASFDHRPPVRWRETRQTYQSILAQGGAVVKDGESVLRTDYQIHGHQDNAAVSPPEERWIGWKTAPVPHPTFVRAPNANLDDMDRILASSNPCPPPEPNMQLIDTKDLAATQRDICRLPQCSADACNQGRNPCPCPEACGLDDSDDGPRLPLTRSERWIAVAGLCCGVAFACAVVMLIWRAVRDL